MFDKWADAIARIFEFLTAVAKRKRVADQLKRVVYIYDKMKHIIVHTQVERVLIWKAQNGGGKIQPGVTIYISVMYEDFDKMAFTEGGVKEDYQGIKVDREYLNILSTMLEQKSVVLYPEKLPEGILKDLYEKDGIKYGELHWLHNDSKSIYYASLATTSFQETFSDGSQRPIINITIDQMRNAMNGRKLM